MWAGTEEYTAPGILPPSAVLTNSAGSNSQSVAEHMLACLLALCRKLPQCRDNQNREQWVDVGKMKTISGATVLVVGAGHIGAQFALRCRALGARTVGLKRDLSRPVDGFDRLESMDRLDDLLPQADVVALCLPHSAATVGLMDQRRLGLMKQDAILLNAGRGTVLDQQALVSALRSGLLWGAALDVTDPEPLPPGHPLWNAPNLLLTPHLAGGMRLEITRKNCIQMALDNLKRYVAGQPLQNQVKIER
jgi:phosphoglycerate dehydrogenase-like enzyme